MIYNGNINFLKKVAHNILANRTFVFNMDYDNTNEVNDTGGLAMLIMKHRLPKFHTDNRPGYDLASVNINCSIEEQIEIEDFFEKNAQDIDYYLDCKKVTINGKIIFERPKLI